MQIRTGTARITGGGTDGDDLDIHYEDMGEEAAPPVLLIMGLGAQLLLWRTGFCERLVNRGFRVIRYDNRDVGLSGKLHGRRAEGPLIPALARSFIGRPSPSVYTLEHMAEDAAALLDHLRIDRAHIVGASMGGMIAQIFAARYPQRTAGLGILISSNNAALLPPPAPRALLALIKGPAPDSPREVIVENSVRVSKIIGSPGFPTPEHTLRAEAIEGYDRAHYPQGIARHFGAVLGSGSLKRYDRAITAPTVVIHGRADKLMRPAGGRAIAAAIPEARLVLFSGMAHDLPVALWDDIISELVITFAAYTGAR
ncbi:MAG: alpha/beta hydrolase [Mycobacterium sp.]